MSELVMFGVSKGWSNSACDTQTKNFIKLFYGTWNPGTEFKVIRRPNNKMHYVLLVHENPGSTFQDANGRSGSFFGMSLIFDNKYVQDANKVRQLLEATYKYYIKNKIIKESENGVRRWMVPALSVPGDTISHSVANGMMKILQYNPEFHRALQADTRPLPPLQNQKQRI